jgi:D-threo-aldose 1-dehydrogenase
VDAIGVAAKDWRSIALINKSVKLDWVMIANSMTLHRHPNELIDFMKMLRRQGITVMNSAVFNAGFLTGGEYYNYKFLDKESVEGKALYQWRVDFYKVCDLFGLSPAAACIKFGISAPGVVGIALSATATHHVQSGFDLVNARIPEAFWMRLASESLISEEGLELVLNRITN